MSETEKPPKSSGKRLNSWKEIAAYLEHDVRTVQRWEKKEGLPVHRKLHDQLSSVYAFESELDAWWGIDSARSAAPTRTDVLRSPSRLIVAVLPLRNLSGDPTQDYFSEGLTEELIGELGRLNPDGLGVIARASAMRYKESTKGIEQIARELRATYLIEGSVRRSDNRVRIMLALVRAADQSHLWSATYDRELSDILGLQAEVARSVTAEVGSKLPAAEKSRLAAARPIDPAAYNAYLLGRHFWNQRTAESLLKAVKHFEEAVARDPHHALSQAGIADAYAVLSLVEIGAMPPVEAMPKAKSAARRAIELDPGLAEGHASLGFVQFWFDWDYKSAEQSFGKAIALTGGYAPAHQWYASLLETTGRSEQVRGEIGRGLELDPLSLVLRAELAAQLYFQREYDRVIEESRKALQLDSHFVLAYFNLGRAHSMMRQHREAIAELKWAFELSGESPAIAMQLGYAYAVAGKRSEAKRILEQLTRRARKRYVPSFYFAAIYTGLGDRKQTMAWLKKAHHERCDYMVHLAHEPAADLIRDERWFTELTPTLDQI
jgi:TolB-like protein/Tfp pilus assembly protein PilF